MKRIVSFIVVFTLVMGGMTHVQAQSKAVEKAEKKLERTKLNLLRINDILAEIEQNLEPLKLQAGKAKEFLDLREELKQIEVGLFIHNIETYKESLEKIIIIIQ